MGRDPCFETCTMDSAAITLAVQDINNSLLEENKPLIAQDLKFKAIKCLPDETKVYGGVYDTQVTCSAIMKSTYIDHANSVLPQTYYTTEDIASMIEAHEPGNSAASGTGMAYFYPDGGKNTKYKGIHYNAEYRRSHAMLFHLQKNLKALATEREAMQQRFKVFLVWDHWQGWGSINTNSRGDVYI